MSRGQRQKRLLLVATLVPVSGLALEGAVAIGVTPPMADTALTPDLHEASLAPQAAASDKSADQAPAEPATPAEPAPATPAEPTTTVPTEPAPATPSEPAPVPTDPAPPTTTAPPAEPAPPTPAPTDPAPPAPTTAPPAAPEPDPLPEPAPPGMDPGAPATDPNGDPTAADPGPALVAPPVGEPVSAVDGSLPQSTIAQAADLAERRMMEHLTNVFRLAVLDKQLAPIEQSLELARDAVPAQLHARWQELHDQRLETAILVTATELGYDQARHELAVLVAGTLGGVDPVRLDGAWQNIDPRRLQVMYTALRQVGDPYIANTEGPDRFDCSGLTMYAWRTAGISLAHYSFTQRSQTPAADQAALQPGDLVFNLRSTGGHVMMSLGLDNLIVHAPGTGRFVEVSHYHNTTGFGSPLGALPPSTIPALAPVTPVAPPATLLSTATTVVGAEQSVTGFAGADLANEMGHRYGLDPAILAAQSATMASLRPELLAALGADPNDPRSVADATARYLVAATQELGDVVSGLAALEVGSGAASRSELPLAVQQWVDRVVAKADDLRQPPVAAPDPAITLAEPAQAVIRIAG